MSSERVQRATDGRPEFMAVLGLLPPYSPADVKQAYLARAQTAHPDAGGSIREFKRLQRAYEQAMEYTSFRESRRTWLASMVEAYAAQEAFIVDLLDRGACVDIRQMAWRKQSFGDDFAQVADKLVGIHLCGPDFGDEAMRELTQHRAQLRDVRHIDLAHSRVTDAGILMLAIFPGLRQLTLYDTQVTMRGLRVLDELPQAERINVGNTQISWYGRLRLRFRYRYLSIDTIAPGESQTDPDDPASASCQPGTRRHIVINERELGDTMSRAMKFHRWSGRR